MSISYEANKIVENLSMTESKKYKKMKHLLQ